MMVTDSTDRPRGCQLRTDASFAHARLTVRGRGTYNFASSKCDRAEVVEWQTRPVLLLVPDSVMWKENGRQVAEEITRSRPTMKVLYMSAFVGHANDVLDKNASFIAKPFTPQALLEAVESVLAM